MRGLLSGGVWGVVVGGVALGGISLVSEPPQPRDETPAAAAAPEAEVAALEAQTDAAAQAAEDTAATGAAAVPAPEAPDVPAEEAAGDHTNPVTAQTDAPDSVSDVSAGSDAPQTTGVSDAPIAADAPEAVAANEAAPSIAVTDTAPSAQPLPANVASALTPPDESRSGEISASAEQPVLPNPQSLAPSVPTAEVAVVVDTTPAPELPGPAPDISADAPQEGTAPAESGNAPEVAGATDTTPLTPQAPVAPATPEAGDAAPQGDGQQTPPPVLAIVDDPIVSTLPGSNSGVRVNRLTGDDDQQAAGATTPDATTVEVLPEGTPHVVRYAADPANPDGRPEVSVVLVDDGSFGGAVASVVGIAFPVTVMLSPSAPNATERMAAYRAAGIEVGILASLPPSATPSDAAIFFEAAFAALPETVAVLDAGDAGLQGDADVINQTIGALSEDGRGLVTVSRGLNTAARVAEEQGVPTTTIFRNLDAEGQDARVIRRFMDQAAFRARQESGVVLLGQIRGETISALIQWGAANRASQVAMVPVSAILLDAE